MPEFILVAFIATLACIVKYRQVVFYFRLFRSSFTNFPKYRFCGDPYRSNPEVERDRYREESQQLAIALQSAQDELASTRMERDLALQQRDLRVLRGRIRLGSAFALGAMTCFTSINVAPQIAHDMLAERPAYARPTRSPRSDRSITYRDDLMIGLLTMAQRYYPYGECAPQTCCHRERLRLIQADTLTLRLEPYALPFEYFWRRVTTTNEIVLTSGGEAPPSPPDEPLPTWMEQYALPSSREYPYWAAVTHSRDDDAQLNEINPRSQLWLRGFLHIRKERLTWT